MFNNGLLGLTDVRCGASGSFQLGSLVLEPDFDLELADKQLVGEQRPATVGQIVRHGELVVQPRQLRRREASPRSFDRDRRRPHRG